MTEPPPLPLLLPLPPEVVPGLFGAPPPPLPGLLPGLPATSPLISSLSGTSCQCKGTTRCSPRQVTSTFALGCFVWLGTRAAPPRRGGRCSSLAKAACCSSIVSLPLPVLNTSPCCPLWGLKLSPYSPLSPTSSAPSTTGTLSLPRGHVQEPPLLYGGTLVTRGTTWMSLSCPPARQELNAGEGCEVGYRHHGPGERG